MVKVAVQCVLQDCILIVSVKVNAMTVKWDPCVVEGSRVHVLKEPTLLPRDQRLVLLLSLDIMSPPLVPPISLYVSMESIHKLEHQNASIVHRVLHAKKDLDIPVYQEVIPLVVNLNVSPAQLGVYHCHHHHLHVHCVLLGCMLMIIAHPVSIVKADTSVKLG